MIQSNLTENLLVMTKVLLQSKNQQNARSWCLCTSMMMPAAVQRVDVLDICKPSQAMRFFARPLTVHVFLGCEQAHSG